MIYLLLSGCMNKEIAPPKVLTGNGLKNLVIDCTFGSNAANDSLSGLIDLSQTDNLNYNFLKIDSIDIDSNKYFIVLIEYPNSIYNRLAVYDTLANCYLIDKSLNGFLFYEILDINKSNFIKLVERFTVKNDLVLSRLSLYKKIQNNFILVYRSYAELRTPSKQFYQTIDYFSEDTIKTKIVFPKRYKFESDEDVYVFNNFRHAYLSEQSNFDSLVTREVSKFKVSR